MVENHVIPSVPSGNSSGSEEDIELAGCWPSLLGLLHEADDVRRAGGKVIDSKQLPDDRS